MSKKISQQIIDQRRKHRKDHFTDFDRKIMQENKGNQKGRRDARMEGHVSQGNKSASDFDFNKSGKGHIGGSEIRHLINQGHSKKDITAAVKASGNEVGARAQKKIDNLPSHLDASDPEVQAAHEGQGWGAQDQARYDARVKAKEKASVVKENTNTQQKEKASVVKENTNIQQVDNSTNTNVNQDNDIVNNISGHNNNVNNAQDNSVDTMGGSTKTGNYQNSSTGSNTGTGNRVYSGSVMPKSSKTPSYSTYGSNKSAQQVDSSQNLNAIQDNDIANDVSGDNNYIYNRQDNSIRNYGGDTRVFNYQGGGKGGVDTPVSAAVMGGYYAVDDSHAANAARLDRQITQANDYAKDNMDVDFITQGAIHQAEQNAYIDPAKLDSRIRAREQASFAQSKVNEANLWGDPDQYTWGGVGKAPKPIEVPDFESIGKVYTDY